MSTDYKTMTTAEIRDDFLHFFEAKGCKLYPSSSLVPDDPSLLLTNAGMNQFKEYYQGIKTMPEIGACSCQKCLRTNDIDNIGESATRATCRSSRCWATSASAVTPRPMPSRGRGSSSPPLSTSAFPRTACT